MLKILKYTINKQKYTYSNIVNISIRYNSNNNSNERSNKKKSSPLGPVTYGSLGVTAIVGFCILVYYNFEKEKKLENATKEIVNYGKPALGGPWTLVDQDGIVRTSASFKDKYLLLYFGFTYCPDICPNELVKVGKITNLIKNKKFKQEFQPIFISVDPNRDTINQLKYYSNDFHSNIIYLTGTKDQVAAATKAYRVYFSKANENQDDDEDYLVDHSIVLYLISPSGEFLDFFTQKMQIGDIVDRISKHMTK